MSNILSIPIFPLNGVIFFPETNLPLNIFEEKYLEMINYALSRDKKIGMIQKLNETELYTIGCVGKITSYEEAEDKRYIINLRGISCFKIKKEIFSQKDFRTFEIELTSQNNDKLIKTSKELLINKFKGFFKQNISLENIEFFRKLNLDELVKLIAMSCTFSINEKQMLLESNNINEMAEKLISLFNFYESENSYNSTIN